MIGLLFQFARVAADLGIGIGALAVCVAVAVFFQFARVPAIIGALVMGGAMLGYAHGFHEGDLTVRALWAQANSRALMEKIQLEDEASKARDTEQQAQIASLSEINADLQQKVAGYEKSFTSGNGACLVGARADSLRDIAGEQPLAAGHPAPANKSPVVRRHWWPRPAAGNQAR